MYNEGATPEFIFDQGVYYPTAANYGYYCTGNIREHMMLAISMML